MKIIDPTVETINEIPGQLREQTELRRISSSVSGLTILHAWVLWVPQARHRSSRLASDPKTNPRNSDPKISAKHRPTLCWQNGESGHDNTPIFS